SLHCINEIKIYYQTINPNLKLANHLFKLYISVCRPILKILPVLSLSRNGVNVEGATHKHVVNLIKKGGDRLTLVVISVSQHEAEKLESESSSGEYYDYSDRQVIPISIPETSQVSFDGETYVVYNIYIEEKHICSRRYKEFANLHNKLKKEFREFQFPKFPGKWPFHLSDQQLENRRKTLESYLEKVVSVRVIGESNFMDEFLKSSDNHITDGDEEDGSIKVELRVSLPDDSVTTVAVLKSERTDAVFEALVEKLNLGQENWSNFALFEIMEDGFVFYDDDGEDHQHEERRTHWLEINLDLSVSSINNLSSLLWDNAKMKDVATVPLIIQSAENLGSCLNSALKAGGNVASKTYGSGPQQQCAQEAEMVNDEIALNLLYSQAVSEVRRRKLLPGKKVQQLRELQSMNKKKEYLDVARALEGYGTEVFPHCPCDARKSGHVIVSISIESFRLQACSDQGERQDQEHTFNWEELSQWEADQEAMAFCFEYTKEGRKPRWVKVYSEYFFYMNACVDRIIQEIEWNKRDGISSFYTKNEDGNGLDEDSADSAETQDTVRIACGMCCEYESLVSNVLARISLLP
ncbi:PREDICTED: sorting nexin-27-like, partial [Acropora digitifera]|uniref:sorting nexin-27-like n=1 Tax=Acropora digitifera TaxID=70779 RepID=UPI000779FBBC